MPVAEKKKPVRAAVDRPEHTQKVEALTIGQSYTLGKRFDTTPKDIRQAKEWTDRTANTLSVVVARAKAKNVRADYTINRVTGLSNSLDDLLTAVLVTRTK